MLLVEWSAAAALKLAVEALGSVGGEKEATVTSGPAGDEVVADRGPEFSGKLDHDTAAVAGEDEATGAAAIRLVSRLGRPVTIRQGAGSLLFARPGPEGSAEVGGEVVLDQARGYTG